MVDQQRDIFQELQSRLDALREVLVQDPDNREAVADAVGELEKVSPLTPVF